MGVTAAASDTALQPAKNPSFPYGLSPTWTHSRTPALPSLKGAAFRECEAGRGRGRWAEAGEGSLHTSLEFPAELLPPGHADHGDCQTEKGELI